jgi:hypothetical protein
LRKHHLAKIGLFKNHDIIGKHESFLGCPPAIASSIITIGSISKHKPNCRGKGKEKNVTIINVHALEFNQQGPREQAVGIISDGISG